jgi:hypothetical protein
MQSRQLQPFFLLKPDKNAGRNQVKLFDEGMLN